MPEVGLPRPAVMPGVCPGDAPGGARGACCEVGLRGGDARGGASMGGGEARVRPEGVPCAGHCTQHKSVGAPAVMVYQTKIKTGGALEALRKTWIVVSVARLGSRLL